MTNVIFICKRAIFLMALFLFLGCEKPNQGLGFDTLIGEVPTANAEAFPITTSTATQDSILVAINYDAQVLLSQGYAQAKLLGTYIDPLFGQAKAELITEVLLEDLNPQFGPAPIVDSVNLYLRTIDYYGDTTQAMRLSVHQLSDELSRDSAFYSSFNPILGTKLGEIDLKPAPNTQPRLNGEDLLPSLKIPLDAAFFQQQLADQGSDFAAFASNEDFREYFNGIKVSVDAGPGSILTLNTNSVASRILVFFREADTSTTTSQLELNFAQDKSTKPIGFSTFSQDYQNFPVAFNPSSPSENALYVQPMGGVYGILQLNDLDSLAQREYAINRAYLELPIDPGSAAGFASARGIEVREIDENGEIGSLITDFATTSPGGIIEGKLRNNKFRLEFTQTLFDLLNNPSRVGENPTFAVVPVSKSTSARRTVLTGGNTTQDAPKLIVIYTKP